MTKRALQAVAVTAVSLLALAACGGQPAEKASGDKNVTFGVVEGWTDQSDTAAVLKVILEENGYTVKIDKVNDNTPMYEGLANGDINVLSSSWLERTQKDYWTRYGHDLDDIGIYYRGAQSFLAVPDYSDITSIADLPSHASEFGDQIIGIEPGAGLTEITRNAVMPAYGLQDFKLVTSSTATMIAKLKQQTAAKKPIVVTLWKPFWANQAFPVRALQDPKNAYRPENLHVVVNKDWSAAHPQVVNMLASFKLDDKQFASLEDTIVNKSAGQADVGAKAWLTENPGFAEALTAQLTKK
ncbi:ABC-type proline/glycine betaine transport system, periplasmic component [Nostocoides japonicum T1-X7]|uniref:ABC-type proline/glycine betaine transport system, periplasmic component n=1 Tax=Nostocoides japonicum T1-X7 TaxID=1194083 RepID=A0A077M560_9MICO|nr:glycine betaine ABC transporter substrate-binding protein [Tetrasphaera japonica]CCH80202.1 ABC-type proline/glycine betaine transport system, periplasmic component [Tetrasphaera japonica T1-X7]